MKDLTTAREFATKAHGKQMYGAQPYVAHLDQTVALLVENDPTTAEDIIAAGFLHDVLEDRPRSCSGPRNPRRLKDPEEWDSMWRALAVKPLNFGLQDPTTAWPATQTRRASSAEELVSGEIWQYMDTANGWHEFRHRCHPVTQRREYVRIESTFLPDGNSHD